MQYGYANGRGPCPRRSLHRLLTPEYVLSRRTYVQGRDLGVNKRDSKCVESTNNTLNAR